MLDVVRMKPDWERLVVSRGETHKIWTGGPQAGGAKRRIKDVVMDADGQVEAANWPKMLQFYVYVLSMYLVLQKHFVCIETEVDMCIHLCGHTYTQMLSDMLCVSIWCDWSNTHTLQPRVWTSYPSPHAAPPPPAPVPPVMETELMIVNEGWCRGLWSFTVFVHLCFCFPLTSRPPDRPSDKTAAPRSPSALMLLLLRGKVGPRLRRPDYVRSEGRGRGE